MENASKALLIAGGILIALLTISLVMIMYNNLQSMQNAQEQKLATEQLVAFNKEYEAYNKSLLYGTDVITVVNKAINNNRNMEIELEPENRYYVNIVLKLGTECVGMTKEIDIDGHTNTSCDYSDKLEGKKYELGTSSMDATVVNFFNKKAEEVVTRESDKTTIVTPAIVQFKKLIFTCKEIEYDNITGRVKQITFVECVKTP